MKTELQGDFGELLVSHVGMLREGEGILSSDGHLRVILDNSNYLLRTPSGDTFIHEKYLWPKDVKGKKVKVRIILNVVQ